MASIPKGLSGRFGSGVISIWVRRTGTLDSLSRGAILGGGNGSGFVNYAEGTLVNLAGNRGNPEVGNITLISQSGSIYGGLIQNDGRLNFNLTVSSGQEISTTVDDYMDYALALDSTHTLLPTDTSFAEQL